MQIELAALPWPCAVSDEDGFIHETNDAWLRIFGAQNEVERCVPGAREALRRARETDAVASAVFPTVLAAHRPLRTELVRSQNAQNEAELWPVILCFSALPAERLWLLALHAAPLAPGAVSGTVERASLTEIEAAEFARNGWRALEQRRELREAEHEQDGVALRLQARNWKAFFRDAAAGKALIGLRGETLEVNAALCALTGYSEEQLSQTFARDLRHPDDRARIEACYREVLAGEPPVVGIECRYRHADGHYLCCLLALSLIHDSRGRPLYFAIEVEDITSRREAEAALQRQTRELEHAIAELTRSNAELERFAFVASHDLQEPLRKIRVFGDRLKPLLPSRAVPDFTPNAAADAARFLDGMTRGAARMQNLIDDLLEYGRLQQRAKPFARVDLNALWHELREDFEAIIRESGARIEVEPLPAVLGDRARLRQLFANLLSNALKFRAQTPPLVRVGPEPDPALPTEHVAITVADNGIGFEASCAETIFDVFARLHGHASYAGTGIGLAICRRIAREHGGDVRAFAAPGAGARFVVTLLRANGESGPESVKRSEL